MLKTFLKKIFSKNKGTRTYRDYGRKMFDDVVKGYQFVAAIDEKTCSKCLQLHGSTNPPKLPIHEGCRCITKVSQLTIAFVLIRFLQ